MPVRRRPPLSHRVPAPAGVSLWRYGHRDDQARDGHNADNRRRRAEIADAVIGPVARQIVIMAAVGVTLTAAAEACRTTPMQVRAVARRHAGLSEALDRAARRAALSSTEHGTTAGWRHDRCRCRDCYHAAHPGSREVQPAPCPEGCWCRPLPGLPILTLPEVLTA